MSGVVVFGAGGHGKVVADALLAAGEAVDGFVDDRLAPGTLVLGLPVLGPAAWLRENRPRVALGIGDNAARERAAAACRAAGATLVTAIHPRAVVSASARIEEGVVVMALAAVNPDATLGTGAIVNTAAVIEHDCVLEPFSHVSPNAALAGNCRVGQRAHVGIGASMLQGVRVGDDTIVGGGALVHRDLPAAVIAAGVPARVRRHR